MHQLMPHQEKALERLSNGKVLYGVTGSGKSLVAAAYYMKAEAPKHVYIFTTAKKRDNLDWEKEFARFGVGTEEHATVAGLLNVDSWNNIGKYLDVEGAFIIFDEQRVVGHGAWVKSFLKLVKKNNWILLSATPGDTWMDYAPIFVANGFFKNLTQFKYEHVLYEPYVKFPKIRMYLNEQKLEWIRNDILIEMPYLSDKQAFVNWMPVGFDEERFKKVYKDRWHIYEDRPIKDVSELFRVMRRLVNTDPSRMELIRDLMKIHDRLIVFYSFNYELDILRGLEKDIFIAEWNGHKKDPIPNSQRWIYIVQYVAGAEGWNCIETDAMVLYSLTYSYKNFIQAQGRINRLNSPFDVFRTYCCVSNSIVDRAIKEALTSKKSFNERKFLEEWSKNREI